MNQPAIIETNSLNWSSSIPNHRTVIRITIGWHFARFLFHKKLNDLNKSMTTCQMVTNHPTTEFQAAHSKLINRKQTNKKTENQQPKQPKTNRRNRVITNECRIDGNFRIWKWYPIITVETRRKFEIQIQNGNESDLVKTNNHSNENHLTK